MSNDRARQRQHFVHRHFSPTASTPQPASSDAGFRSYWRSHADDRSVVLMDSPPGREDVRPWLRMHAVLQNAGVRVPRILAADPDTGFLLLEDLGGPTLLQHIDSTNADACFDQAITQLLAIQSIKPDIELPHYNPALIERELALFPDWFLQTHLGLALSATDQALLDQVGRCLVDAFMHQPQVLVHRDFMPRNLMPLGDQLAVLDFQDAVIGPLAYDVLSLFKDAFLSWPQARITAWTAHYLERARAAGIAVPEAEAFRHALDLTGIQRHLKVLGIFARLHHRDAKPHYLRDAPRFLAYLDSALGSPAQRPELHELRNWLRHTVHPHIAPLSLPA